LCFSPHTTHYPLVSHPRCNIAEQEDFTKRADEWRARYAADLSAAESEVSRLTSQREAQRQQLLKLQERYDRELADLADKEVRNFDAGLHVR
jgi:hypothetical protein